MHECVCLSDIKNPCVADAADHSVSAVEGGVSISQFKDLQSLP